MLFGITWIGPLTMPVALIAAATSSLTQMRMAGRERKRRRGSSASA
jgi:hypothetical protein